MTETQIKLMKELVESNKYRLYIRYNGCKSLVEKVMIGSPKKQIAIVTTSHFQCNPFMLLPSQVDVYRISKPLKFFSDSGDCNTLVYRGLTWICVIDTDVVPGDTLLNTKDLTNNYMALSKVGDDDNIKCFCPTLDKKVQNMKYLYEVIAIRPVF